MNKEHQADLQSNKEKGRKSTKQNHKNDGGREKRQKVLKQRIKGFYAYTYH